MEYEVFDREWQRVAVDEAPLLSDQLEALLKYADSLQQIVSMNFAQSVGYAAAVFQHRVNTLWANRSDW